MYQYSLMMAPWGQKHLEVWQCECSGVDIYRVFHNVLRDYEHL